MRIVYGWLLRLYPAPFYERFAPEMVADFDEAYSAACRVDTWGRSGFLVHSYADVFTSVLAEWSHAEIFVIWKTATLVALSVWTIVFVVAALEWPKGPATIGFVMQVFFALTTCAALTIGMALWRMRPH